jgi:hypothetical protein
VVVTVLPGVTAHSVRATRASAVLIRLTLLLRFTEAGYWSIVRALAVCTMAGRAGGFSTMCMAPPPMIAPPAVQAQSFARAILTDISRTLFCRWPTNGGNPLSLLAASKSFSRSQKQPPSSSALRTMLRLKARFWAAFRPSVPARDSVEGGLNSNRTEPCRMTGSAGRMDRFFTDSGRPSRAALEISLATDRERQRDKNVTPAASNREPNSIGF